MADLGSESKINRQNVSNRSYLEKSISSQRLNLQEKMERNKANLGTRNYSLKNENINLKLKNVIKYYFFIFFIVIYKF